MDTLGQDLYRIIVVLGSGARSVPSTDENEIESVKTPENVDYILNLCNQ